MQCSPSASPKFAPEHRIPVPCDALCHIVIVTKLISYAGSWRVKFAQKLLRHSLLGCRLLENADTFGAPTAWHRIAGNIWWQSVCSCL